MNEHFGELRSALQRPETAATWIALTEILDRVEDDEVLVQIITPYLLEHLTRQDSELCRPAPLHWYDDSLGDARRRAYGTLIAINCPQCGKLCPQSEVTLSLKARYGKKYTSHVRTRELMTMERRDVAWECQLCRDQTLCPGCARMLTFTEVTAALELRYGAGTHVKFFTREVLQGKRAGGWTCVSCQEGRARG